MPAKSIDGGDEVAVRIVLENITVSASFQNLLDQHFRVMHGQNKDFCLGRELTNLARGFNSVQEWHTDVEHGDVGLELTSLLHRLAAIGSFGADLPAGLGLKKRAESCPHDLMVIG